MLDMAILHGDKGHNSDDGRQSRRCVVRRGRMVMMGGKTRVHLLEGLKSPDDVLLIGPYSNVLIKAL